MRLVCLMLTAVLAASAQVKLPEFTKRVLPNGVVLELLPKRDVPMITLCALIRGGAEADPADKAGLGFVTAAMLRQGTAKRSAEEFSEQLDFIGATLRAGVDEQSTTIVTEFLSKDLDRALDLFSDAILHPTFPEDEVKKLLARGIDAARAAKDSPRGVTGRYFRTFFYPAGHPYARQVSGDEISLARIGREDMVEYHNRLYSGRNLVITAAGDLNPASLGAKLAEVFGALRDGDTYQWVEKTPPLGREKLRLLLVNNPDATQTYFMIGQPGIRRTDPDRVLIRLVNTLFGGRFTSMLNDELRVNAGLTYGAFSIVERRRLPGAIAISSFTGTETTAKAIDLALEVLRRFRENGITPEQLDSAKAYVKGHYATETLETAAQLAAALGELELYDLDRDEIDGLYSRVDAATLDEANAAIKKHYRLGNLQFVLVGDAAKIKDSVAKYAPAMKVISITAPGFGSGD